MSGLLEILKRKKGNLCKVNAFYFITSLPTFVVTMILFGVFSSQILANIEPMLAEVNWGNGEASGISVYLWLDTVMRGMFAFWFLIFIGQGPTTAGITFILRSYSQEEHVWFFSDWFKYTMSNFRQALTVWILDIVAVFVLVYAYDFYVVNDNGFFVLNIIVVLVAFIYIMAHFYIYPLMITFKNTILNTIKNAIILALQNIYQNLLILLVMVFVHVGIPLMVVVCNWSMLILVIYVVAEILILPALTWMLINYIIYPQLETLCCF